MPDALPLTGLYGKVPAHGDFVRRGLPTSFVGPWDDWLQAGVARARAGMGAHWEAAWDAAPAWRFALPAGACGPDAVAGVMLPSEDQVGRRFPITLAVLLPPGEKTPDTDWFDVVEAVAWAGRTGGADADALAAALPLPGARPPPAPLAILPPAAMPGAAAMTPLPADDAPPLLPGAEAPFDTSTPGGDDVLALLAGGSAAGQPAGAPALPGTAAPPDAPPGEPASDVLALLGAGAPPDQPAEHPAPDVLALLGASAPPGKAAEDPPADVLALLGAAGSPVEPGPPAPDTDGTLAMLIGAGEPGAGPGEDASRDADPLAGLASVGTVADTVPAEDLLRSTVSHELVAPAAEPAFASPAEAPPAPEGGGWWTRGGAHVPPMVWPLAALPPAEDFAYLLEAEA